MPRKPHSSRNPLLKKGLRALSRSVSFHKSGRWAIKNKKPVVKEEKKTAPKVKPFGKKGATRTILPKDTKFYPVENARKPLPSNKHHHNPTKLRSSITPGTVLILLAGRFKGKRVVFVGQLPSGLLLVTGPYKVNGVPIRRVNQVYVIATSTKIDFKDVKVDPKFLKDDYFKKTKREKKPKTEAEFFAAKKQKKELPAERKADQKAFDEPLLKLVKSQPLLKQYLHARFTLSRHQYPHLMKF